MKKILRLIGLAFLVLAVALLFPQLRALLVVSFMALDATTRLVLKLVVIGLLALVVASLLSPLEALGWWAGWYGDEVDTQVPSGTLQHPIAPDTAVSRYVIYLDGIGQADFSYLPEGEAFLNQLATALPQDIAIIRGLIPYSVLNRSLTRDRPFAWFWQLIDRMRLSKPGSIVGFFINLRNMLTVSVSADLRYGPIYNRGIAQVMHNSLINHGYQPGSGIPITLVGFSGGGQISMGSAPFLKQSLDAPIDVISLAGVFCGRNNVLKLEHIYHLAGEKDNVQRLGAIIFPRRWKIFVLSYWNRAKKHGQVSLISLGPVGHQTPGGVMDSQAFLPDGRSYLEQTVDWVAGILKGELPPPETLPIQQISNYQRYWEGTLNRPDYYPIQQSLPGDRYRPVAAWIGRLILPDQEQRQQVKVVWFEVHHADQAHQHLVGQVVQLDWQDDPDLQADILSVTRDVHFSDDARFSLRQGVIHPERLNNWRLVDPLESLAGARPNDDMMVMLTGEVIVTGDGDRDPSSISRSTPTLAIHNPPTQISGRFYALVQFVKPLEPTAQGQFYQVRHFNRATRQFDGVEDRVLMPQVVADENGIVAASFKEIERSPCNAAGWYIYGAQNYAGQFVVQAIAPRALFQPQPDREIVGERAAMRYLKTESWSDLVAQKGTVSTVSLTPKGGPSHAPLPWREGDRALLVHNYGGIGGKKREPAAQGPVYFGHFAYGVAEVVWEPLSEELRFDIVYYQVYAHNSSGLLSCRQHWSHYMGDRQWGFLGIRPVCDLLIKLDSFTSYYDVNGQQRSPLDRVIRQLDLMMARYRIGDGTGATYVGPAHNCAQDSNQALYAALQQMLKLLRTATHLQQWLQDHPEFADELKQLEKLAKSLKRDLLPLGMARADWQEHQENLGSSMEESPVKQLLTGLGSWRTMLPRVASEAIARSFIREGASIWVLRTTQVGGIDPDIEPIAPMNL